MTTGHGPELRKKTTIRCALSIQKDGDDWLVSPAIALKGDRNYKLSVNIERLNRKCKPYLEGNLDIYAGTGDDYTKYKKIDMDSVSVDTDTWITLIQA